MMIPSLIAEEKAQIFLRMGNSGHAIRHSYLILLLMLVFLEVFVDLGTGFIHFKFSLAYFIVLVHHTWRYGYECAEIFKTCMHEKNAEPFFTFGLVKTSVFD